MTRGPDGQPFDWTVITAGHFRGACAKNTKPRESEVAVPYRGYWFYIAANDVESRSVMSIMEILFTLQESAGQARRAAAHAASRRIIRQNCGKLGSSLQWRYRGEPGCEKRSTRANE